MSKNINDLRNRKEELENELQQMESDFENRFKTVNRGFTNYVKPVSKIRKYPLTSVGIAVAAGFLLTSASGKKKKPGKVNIEKSTGGTSLRSILFGELKRFIARRAMDYVTEVVDKDILPRIRPSEKESQ